ncbi:MAG: L-rhamnose/proton symporter RhaT [Verrucomicrobiota bacterium]
MIPNPPLGVMLHAIGGLMSAIFYLPYRKVKHWSWESFWIVGGVFSWIVVPWIIAALMVPNLMTTLTNAPSKSVFWSFVFGMLWGIGGATFGLTVRYLGIALGTAMALGYCAAFGTLLPPIFAGEFGGIINSTSGRIVLGGVVVSLLGIVISGLAGIAKEREVPEKDKQATIKEFNFKKGVWVATFCGIMSACMSYGFAAGKPIAELAVANGASHLWQNLPVLIVILAGGFATNFIWCVFLNIKNKTSSDYFNSRSSRRESAHSNSGEDSQSRLTSAATNQFERVPLLANYILCAVAGTVWYLQFFFYSMGTTKMGKYDFSSWTLHMASIIIFGTLVGIFLAEWKGVSKRTHRLMLLGLVVLVSSTVIIGYGNYLKETPAKAVEKQAAAELPAQ